MKSTITTSIGTRSPVHGHDPLCGDAVRLTMHVWGASIRFALVSRAFEPSHRTRAGPARRSSSRTEPHRSQPSEVERRALRVRPASPQKGAGESGDPSSPLGDPPHPTVRRPAWKTPGQRPDLNKCTLQCPTSRVPPMIGRCPIGSPDRSRCSRRVVTGASPSCSSTRSSSSRPPGSAGR